MSPAPCLDALLQDLLMNCWGDALPEELDGAHELLVRERTRVHLEGDARHAAECLAVALDLLDYFLRVADYQRAPRRDLRIVGLPGHRSPAPLFSNVAERALVPGEKVVGRLLRGLRDVAERVQPHPHLLGRVPCVLPCLPVEVDEGPEAVGLSSDDGHREREPEQACTCERARGAADPEPDR